MAQLLTDASWLPLADVLAHVGNVPVDSPNAGDVERSRLAACAYVERLRPDLLDAVAAPPVYLATPDVAYGALLLAARLFARKGSPAGLASYGEFGPAAVLRLDPDVERLLSLGRHARPAVG